MLILIIVISITTQELKSWTADNFANKLKQAKLAIKTDIADFVKRAYFDDKLKSFHKKLLQLKQDI